MLTRSGHKPLYTHLYFQVLVAILIGTLLGHFFPALATTVYRVGPAGLGLLYAAPGAGATMADRA